MLVNVLRKYGGSKEIWCDISAMFLKAVNIY